MTKQNGTDEATAKNVIAAKSGEYMEAFFGFKISEEAIEQLANYVYGGLVENGFVLDGGRRASE